MAKHTVYMTTTASLSVQVEVDDALDPGEARERAIEAAYEGAPHDVCAQCSGWGRPWSLNLGEWDVENGADAVRREGE